MSSSIGQMVVPSRALTSRLLPCLNSPTTSTRTLGSANRRWVLVSRSVRSLRSAPLATASARSTNCPSASTTATPSALCLLRDASPVSPALRTVPICRAVLSCPARHVPSRVMVRCTTARAQPTPRTHRVRGAGRAGLTTGKRRRCCPRSCPRSCRRTSRSRSCPSYRCCRCCPSYPSCRCYRSCRSNVVRDVDRSCVAMLSLLSELSELSELSLLSVAVNESETSTELSELSLLSLLSELSELSELSLLSELS